MFIAFVFVTDISLCAMNVFFFKCICLYTNTQTITAILISSGPGYSLSGNFLTAALLCSLGSAGAQGEKPSGEDEFSGNVRDSQGEETACSCRKQGQRCLTAAKGPGTACPAIATYWSVCALRSGRGSLLIFTERPSSYFHTRDLKDPTLHFPGRGDFLGRVDESLPCLLPQQQRGHLLSTVPSGPG